MIFATENLSLFDRVLNFVQPNDNVWGWLLLGLGASLVYFLVMLFTRWGDRRTIAKALVFSAWFNFVWVSSIVAVVGVDEEKPPLPPPTQEEEAPATSIQLLSEDPQELPTDGNTPVWNELPKPVETLMARIDQKNLEPVPFEEPAREIVPTPEEMETSLPDLPPSRPESPETVPTPNKIEQATEPRTPADIPVEEPAAIMVPDRDPEPKVRERDPFPKRGPFETQVNREPVRGATDEIKREVDPQKEFASLETPDDPTGYLKRGPERDEIKRRTSPAPAFAPTPKLGAPDAEGEIEEPAGQRVPRRRLTDRDPEDRIDPEIQRVRRERTPMPIDPTRERNFETAPIGPAPDLLAKRSVPDPIRLPRNLPRSGRPVELPSTYRYRGPEQRREAALKFGGSKASEEAVEQALRWLATHQTAEGSWDADAHGAGKVELTEEGLDTRGAEVRGGIPGVQADSGVTALAILAFLGAGYTQEEGPYAEHVERAVNWMVKQQHEDGFLGGNATYYAQAYCHGMATYALAEAYGMRSDPTRPSPLREPLEKAIKYILDHQHPSDGGWRYRKGETGDMSIFGWNMMALKSAEIAGLTIPEANRNLLIKFLRDRSLGQNNGLASYHPKFGTQGPTPTMTAEALFSKQMLGLQRTNPASKEAIDYLMNHLPGREDLDFYYWYYGTLAVYQYGGEPFKRWNARVRDLLVDEQLSTGKDRGSWDPKDRWGGYGGRVYSTALNTLILEVYYRFLPLYQLNDPNAKP